MTQFNLSGSYYLSLLNSIGFLMGLRMREKDRQLMTNADSSSCSFLFKGSPLVGAILNVTP